MDNLLNTVRNCLGYRQAIVTRPTASFKKQPHDHKVIADNILTTLFAAEKAGKDLEESLQDIVGTYGWSENIAQAILGGLVNALKSAAPMGQAMKEAFERVSYEARELVNEHPVFVTVVALGILVLLVPWALEALGFAELGIVEGSWAAEWQSTYAGYVPKGSLFAFFQRLGMIWH